MNTFCTPLYFCHFWWGSKDKSFEIFNDHMFFSYQEYKKADKYCYWLVKTEGFYFTGVHNPTPGPFLNLKDYN